MKKDGIDRHAGQVGLRTSQYPLFELSFSAEDVMNRTGDEMLDDAVKDDRHHDARK
jgi:hypothetical protein